MEIDEMIAVTTFEIEIVTIFEIVHPDFFHSKLNPKRILLQKFIRFHLFISRGRSSYRGRGRSHFRHDRMSNIPLSMQPADYNNYQAPPITTSGYDDGQYHLAPRYAMFDFIKLFILCIDRLKFDRSIRECCCEFLFYIVYANQLIVDKYVDRIKRKTYRVSEVLRV